MKFLLFFFNFSQEIERKSMCRTQTIVCNVQLFFVPLQCLFGFWLVNLVNWFWLIRNCLISITKIRKKMNNEQLMTKNRNSVIHSVASKKNFAFEKFPKKQCFFFIKKRLGQANGENCTFAKTYTCEYQSIKFFAGQANGEFFFWFFGFFFVTLWWRLSNDINQRATTN